MVETISDLKNSKAKRIGTISIATASAERLKKFLSGLSKSFPGTFLSFRHVESKTLVQSRVMNLSE